MTTDETTENEQCAHEYVYGGVKYEIGGQRSGTGARSIYYYVQRWAHEVENA